MPHLVSEASSDDGGGTLSGSSGSSTSAFDRHSAANSTVGAGIAAEESTLLCEHRRQAWPHKRDILQSSSKEFLLLVCFGNSRACTDVCTSLRFLSQRPTTLVFKAISPNIATRSEPAVRLFLQPRSQNELPVNSDAHGTLNHTQTRTQLSIFIIVLQT